MATVILEFLPPTEPDITFLHVEEAPSSAGVFSELATHPAGVYPHYISQATVTDAVSALDWFRIRWENSSGGFTPYSQPMPGGTTTYLSKLVDRVMLRMPFADENIVAQEAEAVIEEILKVDPYSSDDGLATFQTWSGMTYLTLARVGVSYMIVSESEVGASYTAGLVQQKSNTGATVSEAVIDRYIREANRLLNISVSRILLMKEITVGGGYKRITGYDVTRSLIEVQ